MLNLTLFLLCILSCLKLATSWSVNCDDVGSCTIHYSSESIVLEPGKSPYIGEKFISPLKNISNSIPTPTDLTSLNQYEQINSYIGKSKYQCADGFKDCIHSCCLNGVCSDPSNACIEYEDKKNVIIMVVSIIFGFFIIVYWSVFYYIGLKHNSKPIVSLKNKDIYNKNPSITGGKNSQTSRSDNLYIKNPINNRYDDLAANSPHIFPKEENVNPFVSDNFNYTSEKRRLNTNENNINNYKSGIGTGYDYSEVNSNMVNAPKVEHEFDKVDNIHVGDDDIITNDNVIMRREVRFRSKKKSNKDLGLKHDEIKEMDEYDDKKKKIDDEMATAQKQNNFFG